MIVVPASVKVHLALGHTDMRKGLDGLATLIQKHLKKDPFSGHLFVFRGKNASLLKILFWDGTGLCLFTKRIDRGNFFWPRVAEPGGLGDADAGAARDADRGHRLARAGRAVLVGAVEAERVEALAARHRGRAGRDARLVREAESSGPQTRPVQRRPPRAYRAC